MKALLGRLAALAFSVLAVFVGFAMFQDRLLYFPQKARVEDLAAGALRAWPSVDDFRGLMADAQGATRGTAVVFHGNAGHAGQRAYYASALAPLGLRVILAEYPGYGPRDGPVGEASLVADAVHTIEIARSEFGAPLLVVGESLGAGVAAAAAGTSPDRVDALLLITPWDRLERVASYHYPWLPVGWLLRDRYDSAGHLKTFAKPKAVVVAMRDDVVPREFGEALHDALPAPKRLVRLPGSGHNDWFGRVDRAWWAQAIDDLLGPAPPR